MIVKTKLNLIVKHLESWKKISKIYNSFLSFVCKCNFLCNIWSLHNQGSAVFFFFFLGRKLSCCIKTVN